MVSIPLGHGPDPMKRDNSSFSLDAGLARAQPQSTSAAVTKRPYRKPELVSYGRVEDMTRAGAGSSQEFNRTPTPRR